VLYLLGAIGAVARDEAVSAHCRHEAHDSRPLTQGFERWSSESGVDNDFLLSNLTRRTGEKFHPSGTQDGGFVKGQGGAGRERDRVAGCGTLRSRGQSSSAYTSA
jgi:hypothetical protein